MPRSERSATRLFWTRHVSLRQRILAVNILALALLAGGFFYLDSFRSRVIDTHLARNRAELELIAAALSREDSARRPAIMVDFAHLTGERLRLYDPQGEPLADSFELGGPRFALRDPDTDAAEEWIARILDRGVDTIVNAAVPPDYAEPRVDRVASWPELREAAEQGEAAIRLRYAPDRTPVISVAVPVGTEGALLLSTDNARQITETVRAERLRLVLVLLAIALVSVLLSLFLARTIALPLRRLARAAVRVRLGRSRDVEVPRLPERRDEIGLLARTLADMTNALRQRIDAVESFAADVAHELKNPIASIRSALEGLGRVSDPALRDRLVAIATDDLHRLDRLVTDIAEASRVDARLTRTAFEPIDIAELMAAMVAGREARALQPDHAIRFAPPPPGTAIVPGDGTQLERVFDNLIDNALSFSPEGAPIEAHVLQEGGRVLVTIADHGPGVPPAERETIFRRFHSARPDSESFGTHSGLGLAIARTIVEAHSGRISVSGRPDGASGACFLVDLPAYRPVDDAD